MLRTVMLRLPVTYSSSSRCFACIRVVHVDNGKGRLARGVWGSSCTGRFACWQCTQAIEQGFPIELRDGQHGFQGKMQIWWSQSRSQMRPARSQMRPGPAYRQSAASA